MEVLTTSITKNPAKDAVNGVVVDSTNSDPSQYSPSSSSSQMVGDDPMKKNIIGATEKKEKRGSADDQLPPGAGKPLSSSTLPYNHDRIPRSPFASFFVPHPLPPPGLYDRTTLSHIIAHQIDYYFCDDNLATDLFLKNRMDNEGWVPIDLIAGFRRVSRLSKDTKFVLESLIYSKNVEVEGQKVRRRGTWKKWLLNHPKPESKI